METERDDANRIHLLTASTTTSFSRRTHSCERDLVRLPLRLTTESGAVGWKRRGEGPMSHCVHRKYTNEVNPGPRGEKPSSNRQSPGNVTITAPHASTASPWNCPGLQQPKVSPSGSTSKAEFASASSLPATRRNFKSGSLRKCGNKSEDDNNEHFT
jgi:hypothetical protein